MYKEDLALNNLQGLICHKIKPNQTIHLVRAVEYTDCISKERYPPISECSGYDTKPTGGEASILVLSEM